MFDFDKQYKEAVKKVEEAVEQVKQANEFWVNSILTTYKTFCSTKK